MNRIESGVISRRRLLGTALPLTAAVVLFAGTPREAAGQESKSGEQVPPAEIVADDGLGLRRFAILIGAAIGGLAPSVVASNRQIDVSDVLSGAIIGGVVGGLASRLEFSSGR